MPIKHHFQSGRGDNGDAGAVQPSHWNSDHDLTGLLALLDALAVTPNVVLTINGSNVAALVPTAQFAPTLSPTFTGVPLAPTPAPNVNSNQIATMAALQTAIANLVATAPTTLDTLNEIAAALGDDPNFSATITAALGNRLRVDAAQGLSGGQQAQGRSNLALGTAATLNVGVTANNVVQLDGSAKLPAVDGSQLTNIAFSGALQYNISQSLTGPQQSQAQSNLGLPVAHPNYLSGLTLSTAGASTTFSVAGGAATDSTNTDIMVLSASISKTTAAWVVGSGNGGLDTGAIAANTWYHVYEIKRPDTGVVDACVSLSASAPTTGGNIPAAYTKFRRIGSLKTNGSSQWTGFSQFGDEFLWSTPVNDVNVINLGTAATLYTLSVPTGVKVRSRLRGFVSNASVAIGVLINSPDEASTAANTPTGNETMLNPVAGTGMPLGELMVRTDTSARVRAIATAASTSLAITTFGWFDDRGK